MATEQETETEAVIGKCTCGATCFNDCCCPAEPAPAPQTYCKICDQDFDAAKLYEAVCGLCWEQHARDFEADGDFENAKAMHANARRAYDHPAEEVASVRLDGMAE
jgi:hypothetical protein